MADLKPCPHCNSPAYHTENYDDGHLIRCIRNITCGASIGPFETKALAEAAWDTRNVSAPVQGVPDEIQCMKAEWHEMSNPICPELGTNKPPVGVTLWLFDGEFYGVGQYKSADDYPACFWSVEADHGGDFEPTHWALPWAPVAAPTPAGLDDGGADADQ